MTSTGQSKPGPDIALAGGSAIVEHLRRRGLVSHGDVVAERLSGGVSNDVTAVRGAGVNLVVKRALPRLRVAEEWLADPDRVLAEADALRVAAQRQPAHVPPVLDVDRMNRVIIIGHAEDGAHEWKADLLRGEVDQEVASRLGTVLAGWHRSTAGSEAVIARFGDLEAFEQLRVDPFHRWIARRHPDLAPAIDAAVERMYASRACLVHGDFSPKNVLLGPSTTWVIDWEVAHYGDPTFDLAFLLTHLMCKALLRPESAEQYRSAGDTFLTAYRNGISGSDLEVDQAHLTTQTACLLLARMDGKSPAPYLDEPARERGRRIARAVIADGAPAPDYLWRQLS